MSKPIGAMGAELAMPQTGGTSLDMRGNPPRYTNLPRAEAWAKIDKEDADKAELIRKREIQLAAEKLVAGQAIIETQPVVAALEAGPVEHVGPIFELSEITTVLAALNGENNNIVSVDNTGIVVTIDGLKVSIKKA